MDTSNIVIIAAGLGIAMVLAVIIDYVAKAREKRYAARTDPDRQEVFDLDECEATRSHETMGSCNSPTRADLQPQVKPPGQSSTYISTRRAQRARHLE